MPLQGRDREDAGGGWGQHRQANPSHFPLPSSLSPHQPGAKALEMKIKVGDTQQAEAAEQGEEGSPQREAAKAKG